MWAARALECRARASRLRRREPSSGCWLCLPVTGLGSLVVGSLMVRACSAAHYIECVRASKPRASPARILAAPCRSSAADTCAAAAAADEEEGTAGAEPLAARPKISERVREIGDGAREMCADGKAPTIKKGVGGEDGWRGGVVGAGGEELAIQGCRWCGPASGCHVLPKACGERWRRWRWRQGFGASQVPSEVGIAALLDGVRVEGGSECLTRAWWMACVRETQAGCNCSGTGPCSGCSAEPCPVSGPVHGGWRCGPS